MRSFLPGLANRMPETIRGLLPEVTYPQFPKDRVGRTMSATEDGQRYSVFREVVIKPKAGRPEVPGGVFRVWFHTRMALPNTIRLSYLTLFGFLGLLGDCFPFALLRASAHCPPRCARGFGSQ